VRVVLGPIARSGIEAHLGCDLDAGIRAALFHYVGKLKNGRGPVEYPSFLQDRGFGESAVEVEVELDQEVEATIVEEAERQHLTVAQLAGHAILAYLAELDSITEPRASLSHEARR
jgi:predicted HD phosphohydrolase